MKRTLVFAAGGLALLGLAHPAQAQYGYPNPYYYSAPAQSQASYNAFSYPAAYGSAQMGYGQAQMGYGSYGMPQYGYPSAGVAYSTPQYSYASAPIVYAPAAPAMMPAQQPAMMPAQQPAMLVSRPAGQPTLPAPLPPGEPIQAPAGAGGPDPAATKDQGPALEAGPACGEPDAACGPACPPQACPKAGCDKNDPRFVPVLSFGFDDWRGIGDTDFQDNFGMRAGINLGVGLYDKWGIGAQAGASFGGYNFDGRGTGGELSPWQTQTFLTAGLFKRADKGWPFTVAVVYDWMINDNFGTLSNEPSLGQLRGLFSVPLGEKNDLGVWGTLRTNRSVQAGIPYEAVDQYNVFWKHWFPGGSDTTVYVGMTDGSRHGIGPGSLGSWIAGGSFHVPLSDHLAVFGDLAYMRPSSNTGTGNAAFENSYNLSVGIAFYPCSCLRQRSSCNRGWLPVLPVANNGTFFVDTAIPPG